MLWQCAGDPVTQSAICAENAKVKDLLNKCVLLLRIVVLDKQKRASASSQPVTDLAILMKPKFKIPIRDTSPFLILEPSTPFSPFLVSRWCSLLTGMS